MRKFWIALLTLGLVAAFAMTAAAAESVKLSGTYYARGWFVDNSDADDDSNSRAFYNQRLRTQIDIKVAENLTLTGRFDAIEKKWGNSVWNGSGDTTSRQSVGAAGAKEQESIEFERAYLSYISPIGFFAVGYQEFATWGTLFLDGATSRAGIKYAVPVLKDGKLTLVASVEKGNESDGISYNDDDTDAYDLGVITKFKGGEAGILYQYARAVSYLPLPAPIGTQRSVARVHVLDPYVKFASGPVSFEAEAAYLTGDIVNADGINPAFVPFLPSGSKEVEADTIALYAKANVDLAPVYVGGIFAYGSGDEDRLAWGINIAQQLKVGNAFNPCLIFGNDDYNTWVGGAVASTFMDNMWFYQINGGVKPMKNLDIFASFSYMYADETLAGVDDEYGMEFDLTATYKITPNLSYMVGGSYFWIGDWYKMGNDNAKIDDVYMLTHQLTLKF